MPDTVNIGIIGGGLMGREMASAFARWCALLHVPGTFMIFDELVAYPGFEGHEILSLYLWMVQTNAELCAVGVKRKIEGVLRNPELLAQYRLGEDAEAQSAAFFVIDLDY
jgi:hypothetical protein